MQKSIKDNKESVEGLVTPKQKRETVKRSRSSPEFLEKTKISKTEERKSYKMGEKEGNKKDYAELMKQFSMMLDAKGLATKDDITDLKAEIKQLREENLNLRVKMEKMELDNERKDRRLEAVENHLRRNNLIFKGFDGKENVEDVVNFCKDVLEVEVEGKIENSFFLGKDGKGLMARKVMFTSSKVVTDILRNTRKLKGTGFYVDRDYTWNVRNRRRRMFWVRKEIKKRDGNVKCIVKKDILVLNGKEYQWDEENGVTGKKEDIDYLRGLLKEELWLRCCVPECQNNKQTTGEEGKASINSK